MLWKLSFRRLLFAITRPKWRSRQLFCRAWPLRRLQTTIAQADLCWRPLSRLGMLMVKICLWSNMTSNLSNLISFMNHPPSYLTPIGVHCIGSPIPSKVNSGENPSSSMKNPFSILRNRLRLTGTISVNFLLKSRKWSQFGRLLGLQASESRTLICSPSW